MVSKEVLAVLKSNSDLYRKVLVDTVRRLWDSTGGDMVALKDQMLTYFPGEEETVEKFLANTENLPEITKNITKAVEASKISVRFNVGDRVKYNPTWFDSLTMDIEEGELGTVTKGEFGLYTDPGRKFVAVDWDKSGYHGASAKSLEKLGKLNKRADLMDLSDAEKVLEELIKNEKTIPTHQGVADVTELYDIQDIAEQYGLTEKEYNMLVDYGQGILNKRIDELSKVQGKLNKKVAVEDSDIIEWYRRVATEGGIDWSADLYGNMGVLKRVETREEAEKMLKEHEDYIIYVYDDDIHLTTRETAEWWDTYIDMMEEADDLESSLLDALSDVGADIERNEVLDRISRAMEGIDMEYEQEARFNEIEEIAKEYEIWDEIKKEGSKLNKRLADKSITQWVKDKVNELKDTITDRKVLVDIIAKEMSVEMGGVEILDLTKRSIEKTVNEVLGKEAKLNKRAEGEVWYEVYALDDDGTTETLRRSDTGEELRFDTYEEAKAYIHQAKEIDRWLYIDKWQLTDRGPEKVKEDVRLAGKKIRDPRIPRSMVRLLHIKTPRIKSKGSLNVDSNSDVAVKVAEEQGSKIKLERMATLMSKAGREDLAEKLVR